ncbi:HNH endonuclease [Georgenia yuyongxinii]
MPCFRCGRPVLATDRWQVEHVIERALGGNADPSNEWVSHGRCNESAGGKLGARITNTRRADTPNPRAAMPPERDRRIRGR